MPCFFFKNFLIDSKGHLKLADFNLSKSLTRPNNPTSPLPEKHLNNKKRDKKNGEMSSEIKRRSLMPGESIDHFVLTAYNFEDKFERRRTIYTAPSERKSLKPQDFGNNYRIQSIVGTPNFMAPEILLKTNGYGKEVDWWSLGCCFFDMVMGKAPICGETPDEVFENIRAWRTLIPSMLKEHAVYMTKECYELIAGLLEDSEKRLGGDINTLRKHAFFSDLNWERLQDEEAPFVPKKT